MEKEKPRLARLTAILTELQAQQLVTARQLAEKHNISIRTVYRDIRTLEKSGVPVVTEEGRGFSIMEGYKLPPVMFSEEEANALITAEKIIRQNTDESLVNLYESAITKIKSVLKGQQKEKTELLSERIQIRKNLENEKTSDRLIQLQSAITNFNVTQIKYFSLQEKQTERNIEPFAIYNTNDNWIVIGWCQTKQEFRAFRLDRIQAMVVLPQTFEPQKITLEEYFEICRQKRISNPWHTFDTTPRYICIKSKINNDAKRKTRRV